jgi:hypothetical protein
MCIHSFSHVSCIGMDWLSSCQDDGVYLCPTGKVLKVLLNVAVEMRINLTWNTFFLVTVNSTTENKCELFTRPGLDAVCYSLH